MKYLNSFRLFFRAVRSTRHEMWVSLQILFVLTILLSILLFIVEHNAQPDVFSNYWDAFLWSWMGYIDDPGGFADYSPITTWGRILKVMCALVNIAIFAIPAGLVAGGFSDAIAEDRREKELEELKLRLGKAFRRKQDKATMYKVVPRYVSPIDVQSMQEIDMKDVTEAVRNSKDYRFRNLATAQPSSEQPLDRLVIELIPSQGRTVYGCFIDRGSNVTIVAPSAAREVAIGHFAYHVALFGGFNFISREFDVNKDEPHSYYIIDDETRDDAIKQYMSDLRGLSKGEDKWTIFLIVSDSVWPEYFHFITKKQSEDGTRCTVSDEMKIKAVFNEVKNEMQEKYGFLSEMDLRYRPAGKKNVTTRINGGEDCNAFTIRADWSMVAFHQRNTEIALLLSRILGRNLAEGWQERHLAEWKENGYGYHS